MCILYSALSRNYSFLLVELNTEHRYAPRALTKTEHFVLALHRFITTYIRTILSDLWFDKKVTTWESNVPGRHQPLEFVGWWQLLMWVVWTGFWKEKDEGNDRPQNHYRPIHWLKVVILVRAYKCLSWWHQPEIDNMEITYLLAVESWRIHWRPVLHE